jgi:hypothetical protein
MTRDRGARHTGIRQAAVALRWLRTLGSRAGYLRFRNLMVLRAD